MKPLPETTIFPVLPEEYQFDWNNPIKKELEKIPEKYFPWIAEVYFKFVPTFQLNPADLKNWTIESIIKGKEVKIKVEEDRVY